MNFVFFWAVGRAGLRLVFGRAAATEGRATGHGHWAFVKVGQQRSRLGNGTRFGRTVAPTASAKATNFFRFPALTGNAYPGGCFRDSEIEKRPGLFV